MYIKYIIHHNNMESHTNRKYYIRQIKITKTKNKNKNIGNLLFCYTGDEYKSLNFRGTYNGQNKHECLNTFSDHLYYIVSLTLIPPFYLHNFCTSASTRSNSEHACFSTRAITIGSSFVRAMRSILYVSCGCIFLCPQYDISSSSFSSPEFL